jgi:hypothetical protein
VIPYRGRITLLLAHECMWRVAVLGEASLGSPIFRSEQSIGQHSLSKHATSCTPNSSCTRALTSAAWASQPRTASCFEKTKEYTQKRLPYLPWSPTFEYLCLSCMPSNATYIRAATVSVRTVFPLWRSHHILSMFQLSAYSSLHRSSDCHVYTRARALHSRFMKRTSRYST